MTTQSEDQFEYPTPKTKKACRQLGLKTASQWWTSNRVPQQAARGILVKGETFFAECETEEAISKTEADRRGLKPIGEPVGSKSGAVGGGAKHREWEVYRVSECEPKQERKTRPPRLIDVLAATFAVNRAAKRFRDAASEHYLHGTHGFAGSCSQRKAKLYALKDRGIVVAYREGRIHCEGIHGALAIYRGEGYCFHSFLFPMSLDEQALDPSVAITVEAKPRESQEPRLMDAEHTLSQLPDHTHEFRRLELPAFEESRACEPVAGEEFDGDWWGQDEDEDKDEMW